MMTTAIAPKRPEIKTALPGPKARSVVEADAQFVNPAYPRPSFKLVAERAEGVWVEDVDGNLFLDCNAGVAVCSTGHCHPEVVAAIQQQAARLIHMCGTDYYYSLMPELAEKLDAIVPVKRPTRTHFANSGTEAVETALKLAMHATGREKFISFFGSFHGRTLGSLSLTSSKIAQRLGFKRQALDVVHVPYPNEYRNPFRDEDCGNGGAGQGALNWIENRLFKTTTPAEEVAAIVVEPVQGEGGYVPAPQGFLKGLRRICDEHGILLVLDEVQSGMGRTGKMFASEYSDAEHDIICIDRKSTRLNSSHVSISYAVFCLKKKKEVAKGYGTRRGGDLELRVEAVAQRGPAQAALADRLLGRGVVVRSDQREGSACVESRRV